VDAGGQVTDTAAFYDALSADYHRLFLDWEAALGWQSGLLERVLAPLLGPGPWTLLDATAGIGTQALGLAQRGHRVHANDLSAASMARLRAEAAARGISLAATTVADVRAVDRAAGGPFDAVLSCDNAVPHLLDDAALADACTALRRCVRAGGWALLTIRDYDEVLAGAPRRTTVTPVRVLAGPEGRRLVFQVWDWAEDGERYAVSQFIVGDERADGAAATWSARSVRAEYRALRRATLTAALAAAGFAAVGWRMPEETGFYQPMVLAQAQAGG
jgi:glycine/sarcosine N-methyltransferase